MKFYKRRFLIEFTGGTKDARVGMGYGRASTPNGAGGEYSASSDFPYTDKPAEIDSEIEDEDAWTDDSVDAFLKKTGHHAFKNSGNRPDRGSLAHSSQRGLGESQGMVPKVGLYRTPGQGTASDQHIQSPLRTGPGHAGGNSGSKAGWFGAPPPLTTDVTPPVYELEDLPDSAIRSLEKAQRTHKSLTKEFKHSFAPDESANEKK